VICSADNEFLESMPVVAGVVVSLSPAALELSLSEVELMPVVEVDEVLVDEVLADEGSANPGVCCARAMVHNTRRVAASKYRHFSLVLRILDKIVISIAVESTL
jgi:hypothetical protein